jgi:hypothetical protein
MSAPRPPLSALGLNRVAGTLLLTNIVLAGFSAIGYPLLGLSFAWHSAWRLVTLPLALLLLWCYLARTPGRSPWDWAVAERILALAIFCLTSVVQPQLQYVGLALKRPLIDEWLAATDTLMGVRLVEWTAWTRHHRPLLQILVIAYSSFGMQLCFPLLALGIRNLKDRAALWEYLFHLTTCVTLTMFLFAWFPSNSSSTVYLFKPLIGQTTVVQHITDVRNGRMTNIDLTILEGLISFPSFHVAGAMIVSWTFRHRLWMFYPLMALNVCLIAATLLLGIHYGIDVVAGAFVFVVSVWIYNRLGLSTHSGPPAATQAAAPRGQTDDALAGIAGPTTKAR